MSTKISGPEAIINGHVSTPRWYSPSTLSFFALDDVGCNGSESNLLDCLPQHNCHLANEDAGVQCLRKGMDDQNQALIIANAFSLGHFRSQTRAWIQPRKQ